METQVFPAVTKVRLVSAGGQTGAGIPPQDVGVSLTRQVQFFNYEEEHTASVAMGPL